MADTRWIIDGNNLLHGDPTLREKLKESGFDAARRLLETALASARRPGTAFEVIYDGGTGSAGRRGVTVSRASRGRPADDQVLRRIRETVGSGKVVVVTDDRSDIGSRIPISGVRWVSCAQFGDILWGRESGRKRNHGPEKPTTPRTKKAIDYWLDQFADEEM